ncbi:dTMP kinase [Sphaerimonospora thailandensis]|uniref:dTMP kinase n=1 Tax=Sphaerimonospora thailandensis TaxID=795644 RepID=UPI0019516585|nr:dTMP kinase [Sphaerimonospora thailandensis]
MFLVMEGPNGVGKTTTATRLAERLRERGRSVHVTSEPSNTPLGRLIRASESTLSGRALALAVAADRYKHITDEIQPALDAGQVVISDRYVQSSLVLQRLDGLSLQEIWQYNAQVSPPSLSFYLHHTHEVLQRRLNHRPRLSRLEHDGSPQQELALYEDAFHFLRERGWHQARIDCQDLDPNDVVTTLLHHLEHIERA